MKQLTLTSLFLICFFGAVFANTADLFTFNEKAIEAEFIEINKVEAFVAKSENISFSAMEQTKALKNFDLKWTAYDINAAPMFGFSDIDWTSWAWGFCCFPIGIITVILDDGSSNDDRISYFIGIGTMLVIAGPSGLFWWRSNN